MPPAARVYLEQGKSWVFACALDWPGWCRRGKGADAALQALVDYAPRYAKVVGAEFTASPIEVVGRVEGGVTTDFGAPGEPAPWDREPLKGPELARLVSVVEDCWRAFDRVRSLVPAELRKGPRGGGRDREEIVAHVREAERAYARKSGLRLPPGTQWEVQRARLATVWRSGAADDRWPLRYAVRRCAWHVLDHAWEMEDRAV